MGDHSRSRNQQPLRYLTLVLAVLFLVISLRSFEAGARAPIGLVTLAAGSVLLVAWVGQFAARLWARVRWFVKRQGPRRQPLPPPPGNPPSGDPFARRERRP